MISLPVLYSRFLILYSSSLLIFGLVASTTAKAQITATAGEPDTPATSQGVATPNTQMLVPRLIKFSGAVRDLDSKPITGTVDVTFSLFLEEAGGSPLWFETQTVQADSLGRFTVLLGAMTAAGLPAELFTLGEAHWLGVHVGNLPEQPRVMLVSVPYALKAEDAETLGGKPASAFMLAMPSGSGTETSTGTNIGALAGLSTLANTRITKGGKVNPLAITTPGTTNYIAGWYNSTTLGTSAIYQHPTTNNIGIGTTSPATLFEVAQPGSGGNGIYLSVNSTGNSPFLTWRTGDASNNKYSIRYGGTSGYLQFGLGDESGLTTHMVITSAGKVGIGTTTPAKTLDVAGQIRIASAATELHFRETSQTLPLGLWRLTDGGSGAAGANMVLQENTAVAGDFSTANSAIFFKSGGNVGIGTTTPTAKLEVNGTAKFDDLVTFASGQTFTGNGSGLTNLNPASLSSGTAGISITGNAATATSATSAATATSATTAGTATNALNLNGIAGTSYARLDIANTFSANQTINGNVGIQTTPSNRLTVLGASSQAAGKGIGVSTSTRGASQFGSSTVGLWGDSQSGTGVGASADASNALIAVNNHSAPPPGPWYPTMIAYNSGSNGIALSVGKNPSTSCIFDTYGGYLCSGTKSARVPLSDGRKVLLYTIESPELWFEDFGSAALAGGALIIALDAVFADTVNTDMRYHVFLTPMGDCEGLYVANQSATGFEVRELRAGKSDVPFSYRIVARRKGYEDRRLDDAAAMDNIAVGGQPAAP